MLLLGRFPVLGIHEGCPDFFELVAFDVVFAAAIIDIIFRLGGVRICFDLAISSVEMPAIFAT